MSIKDNYWYQQIKTKEDAEFVKDLRCAKGYTWRAVAEECAKHFNGNWGSNQLAGLYMCDAAADILGEDPCKDPW